jgi:hypothetical protein
VSVAGGFAPAWNPNGREIFFSSRASSGRQRMMAARFSPGASPAAAPPVELFEYDSRELSLLSGFVRPYDVAADGQSFYAIQHRGTAPSAAPVTHVNLVQNWLEELKQKVPR